MKYVYEISSQFRIGAYDCLYVALAQRETCDLATADDKLVRNLQGSSRLNTPPAAPMASCSIWGDLMAGGMIGPKA